ncbi:MAG: hypothetical protein P4L82_11850 [Ancalomicrobiaceae bacterium]|nr:hypothetical protein [Ancalomicrobiaceae bacterium]
MTEAEERAHLIEVARGWSGTPFHDNQGLKGVGCDCAHFLARAAEEAGLVDRVAIEHYSPQFMLHTDVGLFESYVQRFAHQIAEADAGLGDIVLYHVGRSYAHGAFIVEWPGKVIHAFKTFGCVCETPGDEQDLVGRKVKFYSFW